MEEYKGRMPAMVEFEKDDEERDLFIREIEDAVCKYIKTGVKSKQLDQLIDLSMNFHKRYKKCFNTEHLVQHIISENKMEVKKEVLNNTEVITLLLSDAEKSTERKMELDIVLDMLLKKLGPLLSHELDEMLSQVAWLSHINMLYRIYEKENKLRKEVDEYQKMTAQYESVEKIIKKLRSSKRMEIKTLQVAVEVPKEEICMCISENPKYFNVKKQRDTYQVSLSSIGRRISRYAIDAQVMYSQETIDGFVYKNSYSVMEGLEKIFTNKVGRVVEGTIKFEGVSPEKRRALQSKYYQIVTKVIEEEEEYYNNRWEKLEGDDYGERSKYKLRLPKYNGDN